MGSGDSHCGRLRRRADRPLAGAGLIAFAQGAAAKVAAIIFAVSLTGLYGVSAMYHRGHWSERAERMMQHLDHSMIYVLIAGTYTPVTLLALRPALGITVLALAWTAAVCGIVMRFLRSPRWRPFGFALYLVMGWLIVVAVPQLFGALDRPELALLFVGGVLYTTGAIVLARNSPNPRPLTFGYHEIWHTMVVAAGACHFMLVVLLVRA
jgi:hemolysin III